MSNSRTSAGLLMYRRRDGILEVLLVHPGGPFFRGKDNGAWTIPKGEAMPGEDLVARARTEFAEELGIAPPPQNWIDIASVKQKGGKLVHAWAFEGDLPGDFELRSNTFELEWPPRSGKMQTFPEIDRADFFAVDVAREKINSAQIAFLDRLVENIETSRS